MNEQNTLPVAYSIFCDDLRQEVGNKISYMGVYQGTMFVESLPVVLPRLCAAVTLRLPVGKCPQTLVFRLIMGETIIAERSFDTEIIAANQRLADRDHDASYTTAFFQITPFAAEAPTRLKSRVYFDDHELKAGTLSISLLPKARDTSTE